MKVGYVLNTYPAPSHSFIRREIRALERIGVQIHRMAMRPFDGKLVDAGDRDEATKTDYVLARGVWGLLGALFTTTIRSPADVFSAFSLTMQAARGSEAGLVKHLIYFLEAAYVAKRARALGLDRLHAHFGTNAATVAMLAQAMGAPPFSFTVHGPEEFDKSAAVALGLKTSRANFTVAISSFGRSQLCRWTPHRDWPRLHVVHCGIEPDLFDADPVSPNRPLTLVSIGRFSEQKGQLLLIEAFAAALSRRINAHLVLIGDGEMRPQIEQAIHRLGIQTHVTLTGWLDEAGVRKRLQQSHGMVLPSFAEGLPMVIMEAMASERPVIATYIAGIPELMEHGKTGWLVPAGDTAALTEAICEMSLTPNDHLMRMGKIARARAITRHNIDTEAGKLAALFAQRPRTHPD